MCGERLGPSRVGPMTAIRRLETGLRQEPQSTSTIDKPVWAELCMKATQNIRGCCVNLFPSLLACAAVQLSAVQKQMAVRGEREDTSISGDSLPSLALLRPRSPLYSPLSRGCEEHPR
jgi:hypothetical protein